MMYPYPHSYQPNGEPETRIEKTTRTLIEDKAIDTSRVRPLVSDLDGSEMMRLSINVLSMEKKRGYR